MNASKTITIQEFINASGNMMSYKSFSFFNKVSNGTEVGIYDVVSDYISEIRNASSLIKLDNEEYRKYMYKPKLLCAEIYGNPELYFIILLINDMADVKEFNSRIIYMPTKEYMSSIISYIYNTEKKSITNYNSKYNK